MKYKWIIIPLIILDLILLRMFTMEVSAHGYYRQELDKLKADFLIIVDINKKVMEILSQYGSGLEDLNRRINIIPQHKHRLFNGKVYVK